MKINNYHLFIIMKNKEKKMIESIRFADIDEEPLIFEEESKSQNVSRENNSYRNLETARFSLTNEEKKEVRGLL